MDAFLGTALHDGTPWVILACLVAFAGVVIGLYTRSASEISSHPYAQGGDGDLDTDPPSQAIGREEYERLLRLRRAARRAHRKRR